MYKIISSTDNAFSNKYIICSFYTEGYYEKIISKYLLPSLREFQQPFYLECVKENKDWKKNTNIKPLFMQKMVNNFNVPIIWLDADSQIVREPKLFTQFYNEKIDLGTFHLDWESWYKNGTIKKEFLSGIIYIKPSSITKQIVNAWVENSTKNPETIEQKHLESAISDNPDLSYLKRKDFPLPYCYISSMPDGSEPKVKLSEPVILQHQASREYKKLK